MPSEYKKECLFFPVSCTFSASAMIYIPTIYGTPNANIISNCSAIESANERDSKTLCAHTHTHTTKPPQKHLWRHQRCIHTIFMLEVEAREPSMTVDFSTTHRTPSNTIEAPRSVCVVRLF